MGLQEFNRNWNLLALQLQGLTGLKPSHTEHPLLEWLVAARKNYYSGNMRLGCAQATYVKFALEDLRTIKSHNQDLYKYFKRELRRKHLPRENYFVLRMELRMASSLISKRVPFEKSESPDFIAESRRQIGIECTSVHLQLEDRQESKDLVYKIESVIKNKSKYNYKTPLNFLAVDISNLLFHEGKDSFPKSLADIDNIRPKIRKTVEASLFQSVLAFSYSWIPLPDSNGVKLNAFYWRFDQGTMKHACRLFLDKHFPKGDVWAIAHHHETV